MLCKLAQDDPEDLNKNFKNIRLRMQGAGAGWSSSLHCLSSSYSNIAYTAMLRGLAAGGGGRVPSRPSTTTTWEGGVVSRRPGEGGRSTSAGCLPAGTLPPPLSTPGQSLSTGQTYNKPSVPARPQHRPDQHPGLLHNPLYEEPMNVNFKERPIK